MTEQTTPTLDDQILNQGLDPAEENAGAGGKAAEAGKEAKEPKDDTLELGSDEAPKVEETEEEKAKRIRSQRWDKRVDNLTARLRTAERELAEARAGTGGGKAAPAAPKAPDPNAKNEDGTDKYEFGEADPKYIKDSALFEVTETLRKEREEAGKVSAEAAAQHEVVSKLNEGMANVEKLGSEKYDDFEEKIQEATEARGGESLHPLIGIGIAVSPAGHDIAYRLATDEVAVEKIEKLAKTNPNAAAIAFGELEGEYMEDDDSDLNPADPLDLARMLGRERARRKGGGAKKVDPTTKITRAPKPAESRARGGTGQFEVSDDTDDFAAFEKKHMRKKG